MMFGPRWEITLAMHLEGTLHIGSGETPPDPKVADAEADKPPEVSEVQRDKDGNAIIPATSLKGALRAQAPLSGAERDALLGERGEAEEGKGRIARLWFGPAIAGDFCNQRFQGMTKNRGLRRQGFVKTAVRIDRKSGASEDKYLFNEEWIGEGVPFRATATLFLDRGDVHVLQDQLARLLAPLASPPGLLIGAHRRHGAGRLRLDEVAITRRTIDPATLDLTSLADPDLARTILAAANGVGPRAEHETFQLRLTCDGPFISVRDKSEEDAEGPQQGADAEATADEPREDDKREVTRPLQQPDGKPRLWPSSLLGALRARAAWLAELQRLRGHDFAPGRAMGEIVDDRDKVVQRQDEVAGLSSVERLFGVAGWRGLISVTRLAAADDCPIVRLPMTSVSIDRFTGGARDQRLFTAETFLKPRFDCEIRLEARAKHLIDVKQQDADRKLFDLLLDDISQSGRGLELGHGAAKGFGWFHVTVSRPPEDRQ